MDRPSLTESANPYLGRQWMHKPACTHHDTNKGIHHETKPDKKDKLSFKPQSVPDRLQNS